MWFVTLVLLGIAAFLLVSGLAERRAVLDQEQRNYPSE